MANRKPLTLQQRNEILEKNAGVCCVCKARAIGINIHHIDHNPGNNFPHNLAVLCVSDHDSHHRPSAYTRTNHLDLSAEKIAQFKQEWESFVEDARKPNPSVLAVLSAYGDAEYIHSAKLVFHTKDQKVVFERLYHLHDGTLEEWADRILEEVSWLNNRIPLTFINEPLPIELCPSCHKSYSRVLKKNIATKITSPDWSKKSIASIYINPSQPSLAVVIFYQNEQIISSSLHKCGNCLHFACDDFVERVSIKREPSIRTQASRIVIKFVRDWKPGHILIGTGNHDKPKLISTLRLPKVWETKGGV